MIKRLPMAIHNCTPDDCGCRRKVEEKRRLKLQRDDVISLSAEEILLKRMIDEESQEDIQRKSKIKR